MFRTCGFVVNKWCYPNPSTFWVDVVWWLESLRCVLKKNSSKTTLQAAPSSRSWSATRHSPVFWQTSIKPLYVMRLGCTSWTEKISSPDFGFLVGHPVMRKRGFNGVILVQQKKVVPSYQFWSTAWFKTLHLTSLIEVWKFCSIISESEVLHQRHSAREICQFIWRFWILFQVHSLELTLRPWK